MCSWRVERLPVRLEPAPLPATNAWTEQARRAPQPQPVPPAVTEENFPELLPYQPHSSKENSKAEETISTTSAKTSSPQRVLREADTLQGELHDSHRLHVIRESDAGLRKNQHHQDESGAEPAGQHPAVHRNQHGRADHDSTCQREQPSTCPGATQAYNGLNFLQLNINGLKPNSCLLQVTLIEENVSMCLLQETLVGQIAHRVTFNGFAAHHLSINDRNGGRDSLILVRNIIPHKVV